MKTITIELFTFEELDEHAKEKARNWYREGIDTQWEFECLQDDAGRVGFKLTEVDSKPISADGEFIGSATETAQAILKEHGESCESFKDASAFLKAIADVDEDSEEAETLAGEFFRDVCHYYGRYWSDQLDYLYSDKQVDEAIIANGYTFEASGKRRG